MQNLTRHGSKRVKQRLNISKSSQERLINNVLERGYSHNLTKGQLRKWIDKVILSKKVKASKYIIYGDKLYMLNKDNQLITLIQVPQNIMRNINKMIERK